MAHRTALITTASIVAVVLASAAAVGANLGILTVADAGPVGDLSASASAPKASGPEVVDVFVDDTKGTMSQQYKVEKAGTIGVVATKNGVRLDDVSVKPGWKWKLVQNAQKRLTVTFKSKSTTYRFVAILGADGKLTARVVQPVTRTVGSTGAGAAGSASSATRVIIPVPASTSTHTSHGDAHDDEAQSHEGGGDDD